VSGNLRYSLKYVIDSLRSVLLEFTWIEDTYGMKTEAEPMDYYRLRDEIHYTLKNNPCTISKIMKKDHGCESGILYFDDRIIEPLE
jgi:hypothetical protein